MPRSDLPVVFLIDVDNTLLDNDRFSADLDERLRRDFGEAGKQRYREHYVKLWDEVEYADYLGALQRFRTDVDDDDKTPLMRLGEFILDYPFDDRVYAESLAVITHLMTMGRPVIISDGDMVLQPRKIQRAGLWGAVDGRVSIFVHKQQRTDTVQRQWPGRHHVMVDDKPKTLDDMKRAMGTALTTVFVRQGHHASEQILGPDDLQPDVTIDRIGALASMTLADFPGAAA